MTAVAVAAAAVVAAVVVVAAGVAHYAAVLADTAPASVACLKATQGRTCPQERHQESG